jgi:hypothetical protein
MNESFLIVDISNIYENVLVIIMYLFSNGNIYEANIGNICENFLGNIYLLCKKAEDIRNTKCCFQSYLVPTTAN